MSNMSYCRFNNTLEDLRDCIEAIEEPCSPAEHRQRIALVKLCAEIALDYADAESTEDAAEWAKMLPVED